MNRWKYVNLLQTVDHLAARKDQRSEPVEGNEVLSVIQRRLLGRIPSPEDSEAAALAYQEIVTHMRRTHSQSDGEQQQAEEEGNADRNFCRCSSDTHDDALAWTSYDGVVRQTPSARMGTFLGMRSVVAGADVFNNPARDVGHP